MHRFSAVHMCYSQTAENWEETVGKQTRAAATAATGKEREIQCTNTDADDCV